MFGLTTKKKAAEQASKAHKRGYAAAAKKARYGDFRSSRGSADYELRQGLVEVRNKSRWLARNSSTMKRFLGLLSINVVGSKGFVFQSRVRRQDGTMDDSLNRRVEDDFRDWWKRPTTCGKLSGVDLQKQAVKSLSRDGEIIWEIVFNHAYKDGIAINALEPDMLDETLTLMHTNGNQIRMGVEIDKFNAPVAYHFLTTHPGDIAWFSPQTKKRYRRVPAERIIHTFVSDRAGQTRGEPWATTIINNLKMLDGFREAEVTGRRLKSSIMGFFKRVLPGTEGLPELADGMGTDDQGDDIMEMQMEPGLLKEMAPGLEFQAFDPGGAVTDFKDFDSQMKKDNAMGTMISNMSLGMETEGVSYSGGRTITLEDRNFYQDVQGFIVDRNLEPVFSMWLSRRVIQPDATIPPTRLTAIRRHCKFRPRGWDWVDPAKDVKANAEALRTKQTSLAIVAAARGLDRDDLLREIQEDEQAAAKLGLTLDYNTSNTTPNEPSKDDEDDTDKDTLKS